MYLIGDWKYISKITAVQNITHIGRQVLQEELKSQVLEVTMGIDVQAQFLDSRSTYLDFRMTKI